MAAVKDKVTFVSIDRKINDLEWKLPVVQEFLQAGYQVDIFLVFYSKYKEPHFLIYILEQMGATIYYQENLDEHELLPAGLIGKLRRWSSANKIGWFLSKLYFSQHKFSYYTGIPLLRSRKWKKFFKEYFAQSKIIFLAHYPGTPQDAFERLVFEEARQSEALVVGLPLASYTKWYHTQIFSYDLIFVSSILEKEDCEKITDVPVLAVGSPQFYRPWLDQLSDYYREWSKEEISVPKGKEIVLVILISEQHTHWEGMDFNKTISRLLQLVYKPGRLLLIKPHPRGDLARLKTLLKDLPEGSYKIIKGAISPWVKAVDHVVSLISMGCLFTLAFNKVSYVYWPITSDYKKFLDEGGGKDIRKYYLRKDEMGRYRTHFDGLVVFVDQEDFELKDIDEKEVDRYVQYFNNIFTPEGSAQRIRQACEKAYDVKRGVPVESR